MFLQATSWRIKSLIACLADITPAQHQDSDNVPARKTGLKTDILCKCRLQVALVLVTHSASLLVSEMLSVNGTSIQS